jgi:hypothetical protein
VSYTPILPDGTAWLFVFKAGTGRFVARPWGELAVFLVCEGFCVLLVAEEREGGVFNQLAPVRRWDGREGGAVVCWQKSVFLRCFYV